jgi:hypothetical protein
VLTFYLTLAGRGGQGNRYVKKNEAGELIAATLPGFSVSVGDTLEKHQ